MTFSMPIEWDYSGHKITLDTTDSRAQFKTKLNGRTISSDSLSAIKRRIDKEGEFPVFLHIPEYAYHHHKPLAAGVRVLRIEDGKFKDEDGHTHYRVVEDTPANRAAIKAHRELEAKNGDMIEDLKRETSDSYDKNIRPIERRPE